MVLWVGCEKGEFLLSSRLSSGFSHLCQSKVLCFWLSFGVCGLSVMVTLSLTLLEISWQENGVTAKGLTKLTEIKLQRETIMLSPVFSTVIHHVAPDGQDLKTGYVHLSAFSQVGLPTKTLNSLNNINSGFQIWVEYLINLQSHLHSLTLLGETWDSSS